VVIKVEGYASDSLDKSIIVDCWEYCMVGKG
jgi:hypothetical protein